MKEFIQLLGNTPTLNLYPDSIEINLRIRGTYKILVNLVKYIKSLEEETNDAS